MSLGVDESGIAAAQLAPVQMLWYGRPLDELERLSMTSFLRAGHPVHLYIYGEVTGVPDGVELRDGREIIDSTELDELRRRGAKPGMVSDYFRAALLYDRGGWWADCDVVCVRALDFRSEFVFGWQDERVINGAVLRLPAGHDAAARLIELCRHPNRWMTGDPPRRLARKTRDTLLLRRGLESATWGATGPAAVTTVVRGLKLGHHALSTEAFYPVPWDESARLFEPGSLDLAAATYAVHLWNEARDGRSPQPGSPIDVWLRELG
jgi:hypothetical protein